MEHDTRDKTCNLCPKKRRSAYTSPLFERISAPGPSGGDDDDAYEAYGVPPQPYPGKAPGCGMYSAQGRWRPRRLAKYPSGTVKICSHVDPDGNLHPRVSRHHLAVRHLHSSISNLECLSRRVIQPLPSLLAGPDPFRMAVNPSVPPVPVPVPVPVPLPPKPAPYELSPLTLRGNKSIYTFLSATHSLGRDTSY